MRAMYWEHNGAEQTKYEEMMASNFKFTAKTNAIFHSYYRYFNDGDFPGWARGHYMFYRQGRFGIELNQRGLEVQEERVTNAILSEYKRYQKNGGK